MKKPRIITQGNLLAAAIALLAFDGCLTTIRVRALEAHECRPFLTITPLPAPPDIPDTRFELTPLGESR